MAMGIADDLATTALLKQVTLEQNFADWGGAICLEGGLRTLCH
jgi:hypothetical protein